ncbi:nucleotidyltransferase domain-containing protein [Olsenella sp. YH-ols2217]|uniref:Nucleotidyltransferase domain-containing protein n=1 Tax=Kribbibacterium absianum TaxID=3044210 RepID=A0ABT6ZLD5_9ACTN|nr:MULTISPECIES: nucleotidyltransferase domain-containing protein [unclassified Olsenella]MDJ1121846.1 nucleotidyltransferase domain-containing protein [Olsenella sp. YH-ols2216]MDJ1129854.1 nucleotidyltransferase domain-containing protein [Olsenella sp. YH-ols2217]
MVTIEQIQDAVAEAAPSHNVRAAWLFGSYARGEADEQSDVDIAVEGGPGFSLFDALFLEEALEGALNVPCDVSNPRAFKPRVRRGFDADKRVLYEAH